MPLQVCMGAMMTCSFGVAPASLIVLPTNRTLASKMPAATIMDHIPMVNIPTFGMCSSPANPTVATATTLALGVLTPMPCIPATVAPWIPGTPDVLIGHLPALNNTCTCNCIWGGVITFVEAGQVQMIVN